MGQKGLRGHRGKGCHGRALKSTHSYLERALNVMRRAVLGRLWARGGRAGRGRHGGTMQKWADRTRRVSYSLFLRDKSILSNNGNKGGTKVA